jgi:hypothetical protein
VPFSKRKPRRNPLQRLSDQRRSLALAGLAIGAVFSAAIFRRRRCGEEARLDPTPPPAPEVTEPTGEPEANEAPRPINAAPPTDSAAQAEPAVATAPVEPATGELSATEASILSVLAQSGRADDDRTALAVATSLERDTGDVTDVLRKLGAEGVVSGDLQTASGEEIWAVTERGVRRLGAQS